MAAKRTKPAEKRSSVQLERTHEELSRSLLKLLEAEPFFAHLLASVRRSVTDTTPTVAVALDGAFVSLRVNPVFYLEKLSANERVAVLKHEVLHLLFRHLFRFDPLLHRPLLFNLAADLVVNQFVGRWILPADAIVLETFPDLRLEPDRTLEEYYARLCALADGKVPDAPLSAKVLATFAPWHSDHSFWMQGTRDDRSLADGQLDRLVVQSARRTGPRGWGSMPAALRSLVNAAIERLEPQLDWRRALRLFGASSRRTRMLDTQRRPSKRYGTIPGLRVRRFARLAVILDTSGSISDADLSLFFAELDGMRRHGAEVTVLECDAAVQRVYPYVGKRPAQVGGRGGTSFDPAFAYLREHFQEHWDGCVYLTDGCAPAPKIAPPCRLLWVLTADMHSREHLRFGRVVVLRRSGIEA